MLCTNESVLIVEEAVADRLLREMGRHGAHLLDADERDRVRDAVFPGGRFDTSMVGKDAATIADRAGVRVPPRTRVLLAPFDLAVEEEPLAHEKLCPVLGVTRVPTARRGIRTAEALLRIGGAGHSAVIHSNDPRTVMEYAAAVDVLRVTVNEGGSTGSAGFAHQPGAVDDDRHRLRRPQLAQREPRAQAPGQPHPDRLQHRPERGAAVVRRDRALGRADRPGAAVPARRATWPATGAPTPRPARPTLRVRATEEIREELRRLIIEELTTIIKG